MPVHPIFVHFPLALVTIGFFADWLGFGRRVAGAQSVGWACLLWAAVGTLFTVISGAMDMYSAHFDEPTARLVSQHWRMGVTFGFLLFGLTIWRAWLAKAGSGQRRLPFMACYAVVLGLFVLQGWYGGELVYSHGAGVAAAGQGMQPATQARQRLESVSAALGKIPGLRTDRNTAVETVGK